MSEERLTLVACGVGLVALPFAWRWVLARPVAPLREAKTPVDRAWPVGVALALLFFQLLALGLVLRNASSAPFVAQALLAGSLAVTIVAAALLAPRVLRPTLGLPRAVGAGLLLALAALPVTYGILYLEGLVVDLDTRQDTVRVLQERGAGWPVIAVAAVALAPLAEELVFRVLLYGGLRRGVGPRAALVASAALFGLVHAVPPTTILPMFAFGLLLGRAVERTGSYATCVVAHMGFNLFGVLAALLT